MPKPVYIDGDGQVMPNQIGLLLPPDESWLNSAEPEETLLPNLPIIDPHHHLWNHNKVPYFVPELAADITDGHNVVATVFADCHAMYRPFGPEREKYIGEVEFATGQAAQSASGAFGPARIAAAMFGAIDFFEGAAVRDVLERSMEIAGERFKGVRLQACWDASPTIRTNIPGVRQHMALDQNVLDAVGVVDELGLELDIYIFHPQLDDVVELARKFPDLTIVLNHCGGPLTYGAYEGKTAEVHADWLPRIRRVAQEPNVVCKLGGLLGRTMEFRYFEADAPWSSRGLADAWAKWIEPCIEAFGADRCMYESNYPVEKMGISYNSLWNGFKTISAGASDSEMNALFHGTAARVYGLQDFVPAV